MKLALGKGMRESIELAAGVTVATPAGKFSTSIEIRERGANTVTMGQEIRNRVGDKQS